ncbi:hypothetical protein DL770_009690 [Monosporascus sp. CRB-9-2]|nr:hypothetical protein DL770_009690 [Monosporascus sp. CRB-9-2]
MTLALNLHDFQLQVGYSTFEEYTVTMRARVSSALEEPGKEKKRANLTKVTSVLYGAGTTTKDDILLVQGIIGRGGGTLDAVAAAVTASEGSTLSRMTPEALDRGALFCDMFNWHPLPGSGGAREMPAPENLAPPNSETGQKAYHQDLRINQYAVIQSQAIVQNAAFANRNFTNPISAAVRAPAPPILPPYSTWAEAGSPTGFPCFMFHGFPGSRTEAQGFEDIGCRHNVRVICPDRPGYGLSTFQPNRRLLDWPADVRYLARHLDLKRYSVLGGSGGGPHALACAYAIPPDELSPAGLLCSAAPWEAAAATVGKEIPESEKHSEAVAARREQLLCLFLEPFAQGSRGFAQEAYILTHPYEFRLENVQFERIKIWHGTKDTNSPIRMVRYMKERLPHCELYELGGETHFTIMKYLEEVLVKLVEKR